MIQAKSAGGIILNKKGEVVIVNQAGRSWSFPKGHVEEGETILQAALREIYEECGLSKIELVKDLGSYKRPKATKYKGRKEIKTIHMFVFKTDEEKLSPKDKTIWEARWVSKENAAKMLTNDTDKDFFAKVSGELA